LKKAAVALSCEEETAGARRQSAFELIPRRVFEHRDQMPIVEAGSSHGLFADVKPEGMNEMKMAARGSAEAGDISCIWWDLRVHENDVKVRL
jgi:hypothetical protein